MRHNRAASAGLFALVCLACSTTASATEPGSRLLLAFTSFRDRDRHPVVYLYEHDTNKQGKIAGRIAPVSKRSDHHPALGVDGKSCVFAAEVEGQISVILYWDIARQETIELPLVNDTPNTQMAPALASKSSLICFESWNRPGSSGRWDLTTYDVQSQRVVETPNLNAARSDERKPALSDDGQWIAYTTNAAGTSLTDIWLYDRTAARVLTPTHWNSPYADTEPALSADGRLLAFVSDRPAAGSSAAGNRDIYLYDRADQRLLPLPGLNSPGQEQSPSISPDGRFLAFVSERLDGVGERDIYLYDRQTERLLPTPALNSPRDEYDPSLVELPGGDD